MLIASKLCKRAAYESALSLSAVLLLTLSLVHYLYVPINITLCIPIVALAASIYAAHIRQTLQSTMNTLLKSLEEIPRQSLGLLPQQSLLTSSRDIENFIQQLKISMEAEAKWKAAEQLAHDIRSPLTVLDSLSKEVEQKSESSLLFQQALQRLHDIASDLLPNKNQTEASNFENLKMKEVAKILEQILEEKHMEYKNRPAIKFKLNFAPIAEDLFITICPKQLKRILSNILNNAAESMRAGEIEVTLVMLEGKLSICIQDSGKGIPEEILSVLGKEEVSHGKKSGSGKGIHHAAKILQSWGGTLEIASAIGIGTKVIICIPASLFTKPDAILLEDDPILRKLWQLSAKKHRKTLLFFSNQKELFAELSKIPLSTEFYLDSDLKTSSQKGEEIAKELFQRGYNKIYLSTAHAENHFSPMPWISEVRGKAPPWK